MVMCIGCPYTIRMDSGTENVHIAAVQYAFRASHEGDRSGRESFIYGTSPANVV